MPQRVPARIELKPAQQLVLAALGDGRLAELSRGAYQELTGMSRSQAAYDLADLVDAGILERVGGGRSTRYRLPQQQTSAHRRWTSERIRAGLAELCDGRETWPSAHEFKTAGRGDLYVAASRYGGIGYWTAELGFPKAREGVRLRRPRRLSWAAAGVVVGALSAAAAVAVVQQWPAAPQKPALAQGGASPTKIVRHATPGRAVSRPKSAKPRTATRSSTSRADRQQRPRTVATTAQLAVRTVSSGQSHRVSAPVTPSPPAAAGPTPIPAPAASSSTPAPLQGP